jgi:dTDP-4-dehydrorhamnose 3,5-epimerase
MMSLSFARLAIAGTFVVEPRCFGDARGRFFESWRESDYAAAGVAEPFVQDNISISQSNVLRGLHYQADDAQGQMVTIVAGRVFDVLVDMRRDSVTFGRSESFVLDEAAPRQIYMPAGVAHGFCVLSTSAILHYKCTKYYNSATERGVRWNDPDLAIAWPIGKPILSDRDANYPLLSEIAAGDLPQFHA